MKPENWITLAIGLVAGLGIGTAITAWIQHILKIREESHQSQRKDLEARYRVIILLMYAVVDFESNKGTLRINRPDLKNKEDVLGDLKAEWYNMMLFASQNTLDSLQDFITAPDRNILVATANSMRKDLGRGSFAVDFRKIEI